jgi:DNA-binding XRE family transcriptional regulator
LGLDPAVGQRDGAKDDRRTGELVVAGYSLSLIKQINGTPFTPFTRLAMKAIELDVSIVDIADHLEVSRTAVYAWFLGRYEPSADKFTKLEKYLERM